ncbi:hypothetical protein V7094_27490 [Priestia megaterium]|uniref:hypothetical protein n=1 Tax=Priestia megaterium TaxID=1404 RepID=UPI0030001DBD
MENLNKDDVFKFVDNEMKRTGLELEELGLLTVVKFRGGTDGLSFKELCSVSKETPEQLKAILSDMQEKGYVSFNGDTIQILKEV